MYVIKARGRSLRLRKAVRGNGRRVLLVDLYHFPRILALIQERGLYYFMKAVAATKRKSACRSVRRKEGRSFDGSYDGPFCRSKSCL